MSLLGQKVDYRNFAKKLIAAGIITSSNAELEKLLCHRAITSYQIDSQTVRTYLAAVLLVSVAVVAGFAANKSLRL